MNQPEEKNQNISNNTDPEQEPSEKKDSPGSSDSPKKQDRTIGEKLDRLEAINKEIENRFFQMAKPGLRKKRRVVFFFLTMIGLILLFFFIFSVITTNFIGSDLLSRTPLKSDASPVTDAEKEELDAIIKDYNEKLHAFKNSESHDKNVDYKLILTAGQLNSILDKIECSKNPEGLCRLFVKTRDNCLVIGYSVPLGKSSYFNVILEGDAEIRDFIFYSKPEKIQVGRMKKAITYSQRINRRINRFLESEPTRLGLPFLIKDMALKDSKIYITLRFRSFK